MFWICKICWSKSRKGCRWKNPSSWRCLFLFFYPIVRSICFPLWGKMITVKFSAPSNANFEADTPKRFWVGGINESLISKADLVNDVYFFQILWPHKPSLWGEQFNFGVYRRSVNKVALDDSFEIIPDVSIQYVAIVIHTLFLDRWPLATPFFFFVAF